ncbi:bacteriophage abortive infection AbiH family protein [Pseudomonas putida]|uniref:bacteriophage abortive infection AbiH family protein n=1 Tax=Pseudomonas putida TaxID=303 RepID=UPI00334AD541
MGTKTLYVIGNGFDLHHGMPTNFSDFKQFLRQVDQEAYDWTENYVPASGDWSNLEQALAELDTDNIVSDMECFLGSYSSDDWSDSGHHDFQYEIDRVATGLSHTLKERFAEWTRSIPVPERNEVPGSLANLDINATFLTFNYTSTLTHLYGVHAENILHIHGEASDADSDIVLGHGWAEEERPLLYNSVDPESADHRLLEAYLTLDEYFRSTFKPSDKIIQDNLDFFEQLGEIEEVIAFGHSMAQVDVAYFAKLTASFGDRPIRWTFVLPPREEHQKNLKSNVTKIGFPPERVSFKTWAQL